MEIQKGYVFINLLPYREKNKKEKLQKVITYLSMFAIVAVTILVGAYSFISYQIDNQKDRNTYITKENKRFSLGSTQGQTQQQSGMVSNATSSVGNNLSSTTDSRNVTLFDNVWSSGVTGGGSLGFTILNSITGNALSLEISALENKSLAKVISSPKLLTTDNKKAEIKQGTQVPYTVPGTSTTPAAVNFKDAFLKLGVTPQVSPNGRIVMDLDISKDDVGNG